MCLLVLHKKLHESFEPAIKIDILRALLKFQKEEERFMNHVEPLCDRLSQHKKNKIIKALEGLSKCGYVRGSDTVKSQRYITEEGKNFLKSFEQFSQKSLLGKITWWYQNRLDGLWKIIKIIIFLMTLLYGAIKIGMLIFSGQ